MTNQILENVKNLRNGKKLGDLIWLLCDKDNEPVFPNQRIAWQNQTKEELEREQYRLAIFYVLKGTTANFYQRINVGSIPLGTDIEALEEANRFSNENYLRLKA